MCEMQRFILRQREAMVIAMGILGTIAGCSLSSKPVTMRLIEGRPQASPYVSPHAYEHYVRAQLAITQGQASQAVEQLKLALAFDPKAPYLHTQLALLLHQLGEMNQADAHLAEALRYQRTFPDGLVLRGMFALRRGNPEQAITSFRHCVSTNPDYAPCYLEYAELLEERGETTQAKTLLETMIRRTSRKLEGYQRLAMLCLRTVDYRCAKSAYEVLIDVQPSPESLAQLAHIEWGLGNLDHAVTRYRQAFDRSDGHPAITERLAFALDEAGKAQALDDLFIVLERNASRPNDLLLLAELWLQLKQPEKAIRFLDGQPVLKELPLREVLYAKALRQLKRIDDARQHLERATHDGDRRVALAVTVQRAELFRDEGKLDDAVQLLHRAISDENGDLKLLTLLSEILRLQGKNDDALTVLASAHRERPSDRQLRLALASALERDGKWQEAIALIEVLRRENERDAVALNFIGFTLLEHQGSTTQAESLIRQALYVEPGQAFIIDSYGWLRYRQKRFDEARQILTVAMRLSPDDAEILGHLAMVLVELKQHREAEAYFQRALAQSDDPELTHVLKQQLQKLRQK